MLSSMIMETYSTDLRKRVLDFIANGGSKVRRWTHLRHIKKDDL